MSSSDRPSILAVDGGNSKAEALLVGLDGAILGAVRSTTISHQQVGFEGTTRRLRALAGGLSSHAGRAIDRATVDVGVYCLAGADLAGDIRRLENSIDALALANRTMVRNDTRAALRAGATRPWGIALICGQGVNGVGVGPTGRTAGFLALGEISGDWGGGTSVGEAGLGAAVRAVDGRGPRTSLSTIVPRFFEVGRITTVVLGLYDGTIDRSRVATLAPVVIDAAEAGDGVAAGIVDRLADELATMALALIRRTGQVRLDPEVVLAGRVLQADHPALTAGIMRRIQAVVPDAVARVLREPPVVGAALLGLDGMLDDPEAHIRAERRLRDDAVRGLRFAPVDVGS